MFKRWTALRQERARKRTSKVRLALAVAGAGFAVLAAAPAAFGITLYGTATVSGVNELVIFDSASPGSVTTVPITGATGSISSVDCNPATGQIYGVALNGLYTINTSTGVATFVAAVNPLPDAFSGFDFNPVTGQILADTALISYDINPATGTTTAPVSLAFAPGDLYEGEEYPAIYGSAFTNNVAGASSTTLYGLQTDLQILVVQDLATGLLHTVGSLGTYSGAFVGFDIAPNGIAYASLVQINGSHLYTINLTTGAATLVGQIDSNVILTGLTAACGPTAVQVRAFTATRTAKGVRLRWRTASEAGLLGFNVFRGSPQSKLKLNRPLIRASGGVAGASYSWLYRGAKKSARYWLQAVNADGSRAWYGGTRSTRG